MAGPLFKLITLALLATQSMGVLAADQVRPTPER